MVVWQQVDAPEYRKGFITVTVMSVILIATTLTIRVLENREDTKRFALRDLVT